MLSISGTTTNEINAEVSTWVAYALDSLAHTFILAIAAVLLGILGLCVLVGIISAKSAYIFKDTTSKKFHYAFLIWILISVIYNGSRLGAVVNFPIYIISCAFAVLAIYGLIRFKYYGLIFSLLYLWAAVAASHVNGVLIFYRESQLVDYFTTPGKMIVYITAYHIMVNAIISGILTLLLSVFLFAYYSRRRYLFSAFKESWLNSTPTCSYCGMPILADLSFCTNCGTHLECGHAVTYLKILGTEKHCKDCGNPLSEKFGCACNNKDEQIVSSLRKGVSRGLKEAAVTAAKYAVAVVLIFAVLFIPLMVTDLPTQMFAGRVGTHNAFVQGFNELYSDRELCNDASWLMGFNSAANALFAYNMRGFHINPHRLTTRNIVFYAHYMEATFNQMIVIERLLESVNNSDLSQLEQFGAIFNRTYNEQRGAIMFMPGMTINSTFIRDGIRFWLSPVRINVLLYAILALGAASFIFSLLKYNKIAVSRLELFTERFNANANESALTKVPLYAPPKESVGIASRIKSVCTSGILMRLISSLKELFLFLLLILCFVFLAISILSPRRYWRLMKKYIPARADGKTAQLNPSQYATYRKKRRKSFFISVTAVLLIFALFLVITILLPGEPYYLDIVSGTLMSEYKAEIVSWLVQTDLNPEYAYSDDNRIIVSGLIDNQLRAIENFRNTESIPNEYTAFNEGLLSLFSDEERYLVYFRQLLSSDEKIPRADIQNFLSLRTVRYQWLMDDYIRHLHNKVLEAFSNLS